MSPEQVEGQVAGPPSDVFSLGSVLAFAGSGTAPFTVGPGGSHASVMYRVVYGEADLSAVDGSVRELVGACLAKDPARRLDLGKVTAYCAEMSEYVGLSAAAFWPPVRPRRPHPGGWSGSETAPSSCSMPSRNSAVSPFAWVQPGQPSPACSACTSPV